MPLDAEVASQILTESRESFAQVSRTRAQNYEANATHIMNAQTNLQVLYGAKASMLLTGVDNPQANSQQALKAGLMFPYPIEAGKPPGA